MRYVIKIIHCPDLVLEKGGVALLWHKRFDNAIKHDDGRIVGIQIQIGLNQYMFIFQIYLPCTKHSLNSFVNYINTLYDLYSMYSQYAVTMYIGDYSSQWNSLTSRHNYILRFLTVNTLPTCYGATCSYITYDDRFSTLIDYICLPNEVLDLVHGR